MVLRALAGTARQHLPAKSEAIGLKIVIEDLSHAIGGFPILNEISLTIETGQIVVFIGPSGCGKSTLLRLVGGLEKPSSGSIRVVPDLVRGGQLFSYVFQDHTLLPWRTVAGNVRLVIENLRMRKSRAQAARGGRARPRRNCPSLPTVIQRRCPAECSSASASRGRWSFSLIRCSWTNRWHRWTSRSARICYLTCVAFGMPIPTLASMSLTVLRRPSGLGHRIVLLSDRPGHIREIIPIDMPLDNRSELHPTIAGARDRVWELIRSSD